VTDPASAEVDTDRPNIARVYDYLLGGSHNFAADRAFAEEFLAKWPDARDTMRANRAFLAHAVRFLAGLRDALAPGSYVVVTHGTNDGQVTRVTDAHELYARNAAPFRLRSHAEILRFFDGLDLVEPGLVRIPLWRPDSPADATQHPERIAGYAGVGRKR